MDQDVARIGTLIISFDVLHKNQLRQTCQPLSTRLLELFQDWRIPATWAFDQPATDPFVKRIQSGGSKHEIALLCQPEWAAVNAGRTIFAQQLKIRIAAAKQADMQISTLALQSANLTENLDLLVKHHVSVIRGRLDRPYRHESQLQPESVRFGVWHAPVSRILPSRHNWPLAQSSWLWKKRIQSTCQRSGYLHLGVDLDTLQRRTLPTIDRILQVAARMRAEGSLRICTLQQLSAQLIRKRTQPAARSILRAA